MPEISRFFGIIIAMYYNDHPPPHFHVRYGSQNAVVGIEPIALIDGYLSPRVLGLVVEWAAMYRAELLHNCEYSEAPRSSQPDRAIDMNMLKDIVQVRPLEQYRLYIRFEDGFEGTVDLGDLVRFEGVFAPLQDQAEFERVYVDTELGTICWPNGADLDPVVLYAQVTGQPIPFQQHESGNKEDRLAS
jgi:Protein of unknown function (DUF2442)/Domain of unknown function (DUF4160)